MRWRKIGNIFTPNGDKDWAQTHASVPIADHITDDIFRIYFTSRDIRNRSHIGWFEIDIKEPTNILAEADKPILAPGKIGAFDMDGVMASSLICHNQEKRLYYIGWNQSIGVPFHNSIGLAVQSEPNGIFERYSDGPVLDRNPADPYFVATPDVAVDGKCWHMWYLSGLNWLSGDPPISTYNLRYANSCDGIDWKSNGTVAVDFAQPNEIAIARPSVVRNKERWQMWFCFRGRNFNYRLGYAESSDAMNWKRQDEDAGIAVSESGWDSEMICYPHVFDRGNQRFMLYNGNGFGRTGIGLAILD